MQKFITQARTNILAMSEIRLNYDFDLRALMALSLAQIPKIG